MGWLVQAEAPPGGLFSKFKEVISSGAASNSDISFYFVHWLTDLAGAEPFPQEGCEKFVLKFPQTVLASFLSSFSIVQDLSTLTETKVFEDYLVWRWRSEGNIGPPPNGKGSIARLRLVVMAQGDSRKVLDAYDALPREDTMVLEEELARTGCEGQSFAKEGTANEIQAGGPALLIYYSPALMQKGGALDPLGAMMILAEVFRRARELNPLVRERASETVTVRIDALKDLSVADVFEPNKPGEVWVLTKVSSQDAQVQRLNILDKSFTLQDCLDTDARRTLFVHQHQHLSADSKQYPERRRSVSTLDPGRRSPSHESSRESPKAYDRKRCQTSHSC